MQTQSGNTFSTSGASGISMSNPSRSTPAGAMQRVQLPSNLVDKAFGEVNVSVNQQEQVIDFTILVQPSGDFAEGWRTGLAIDGSASMKRLYGYKVAGRIHPEILIEYIRTGKLKSSIEDGEPVRRIDRQTYTEILNKGYNLQPMENLLQPLVRSFTSYLSATIDGKGATALVYWGCGYGNEVEFIGEFDATSCDTLTITGPRGARLGQTTHLLPAVRYFVENYGNARRGLFIFLTDGRINDLAAVKEYTRQLAQEIAQGTKNYCKFVLVGVGVDIDRYQLQELDDCTSYSSMDLWDYKIADEMDHLGRIFAEVVTEHQIIAPKANIYDDQGNCVKSFPNGLPARVRFAMPVSSQWFELEVNGKRLRQEIILPAPVVPYSPKVLFPFENQTPRAAEAAKKIHQPEPEIKPQVKPQIKPEPKTEPISEVSPEVKPVTKLEPIALVPFDIPPKPIIPKDRPSESKMQQAVDEVWRDKRPPVPETLVSVRNKPSVQLPKISLQKVSLPKVALPEQWRRYALGFTLLALLLLGVGSGLWWLISGILNKEAENNAEIQRKSQLNPSAASAGIAPIRPPYVVPKLGYLAKKVPPLAPVATNTAKPQTNQAQGTLSQGAQGNLAQSTINAAGNGTNSTDDSVIADSSKFDGTEQGIPDAVTELEILPELINEGLSLSQANNSANAVNRSNDSSSNATRTPAQTPSILKRNLGQSSLARVINRSIERSSDGGSSSSSSPSNNSTIASANTSSAKGSQKSISSSTSATSNSNSGTNASSGNARNNAGNQSRQSATTGNNQAVGQATNPTVNQSNLLRVIVYFDLESSDIKPEEARKLRQFWQKVNSLPNISSGTISIMGHTDAKGDNSFNITLSKERSESVTRFLEAEGMDRDRYRVVFDGKSSYLPLQPNDTKLGRAMNRRVELRFKP